MSVRPMPRKAPAACPDPSLPAMPRRPMTHRSRKGRTASTASRTFSGRSPPASSTGRRLCCCRRHRPVHGRARPAATLGSCASSSTAARAGTPSTADTSKPARNRHRLDDPVRQAPNHVRRFVPVQLHRAELHQARHLDDVFQRLIDEDADRHDPRRQRRRDPLRPIRIDEPRTARPEHEAHGPGTELAGQQRVFHTANAADLDAHHSVVAGPTFLGAGAPPQRG